MKIVEFIPKSIVDYLRLIRNKKKYPGRNILTASIGGDVVLGEEVSLGRRVYVENGVKIGDQTYIHNETMIVSGTIGKFCSIAFNCQVGMWEHPTNYISTSPKTYANSNIFGFDPIWEHSSPPNIGNDVWIGSNAIILRNVTIGDGAIIGAGAIVTKDIPAYGIAVGTPAKVIKYRFDDETIQALKEFKWWDLSKDELMQYKDIFQQGDKAPSEIIKLMNKDKIDPYS